VLVSIFSEDEMLKAGMGWGHAYFFAAPAPSPLFKCLRLQWAKNMWLQIRLRLSSIGKLGKILFPPQTTSVKLQEILNK